MISAGRFQPGYRVRVTVEYSAERIVLCADGSPVVTSISGKIKILSKFRFGVGMNIVVYAAVYQPCKPCQLAWLAYQVPAAFLSRLCEYEITAVIAVQSIFIMVVVGLAEVNTVLLVNRSREFVIAYLAPPRLRTSVELVCNLGGVIGSVQDETVVCFPSAGSRNRSAVSGRDVIYMYESVIVPSLIPAIPPASAVLLNMQFTTPTFDTFAPLPIMPNSPTGSVEFSFTRPLMICPLPSNVPVNGLEPVPAGVQIMRFCALMSSFTVMSFASSALILLSVLFT